MTRKGSFALFCIVFLMIGLLVVSLTPFNVEAAGKQKVYKWRCQMFGSAKDAWMTQETLDSINKASKGQIKIELFSGGAIVPSPDILKATSTGMLQMGRGYGGYWPSRVDVGNIETGLPLAWNNLGDAFDVLFSRGMVDIVREAYKEQGVYWWPQFGSLYNIISTKPIRNLNDLKGMKIRVAGPTSKLLKSVGVATAYLPFEEVYMGLATGTLQGAIMGPLHTYNSMKMYEVAKYYTNFPFMMPTVTNSIINLKVWNKLPDDLKEIIDMALFESLFKTHKYHIAAEFKLRQKLTAKGLLEVVPFDPASVKELRKAAQKIYDEEAAKSPRAAKCIEIIRQMHVDKGYTF
jgi:TRAP-type C4-dicarboxylate transport system substrate-binding protein